MYESWFGFTKRPFVAAPQVDGYYPAEVNESALQALIWCVERGAGPGVVIGATGTGKTTLALMIRQYFKSMMPVALISGGTCKNSRALLQNMLYAFSLPYEDSDEGQLRLSLTEFFNSRAEGRGSLLIVDEADKLDEAKLEEIRTFADLAGENGYAVHVVLVGSPRLEERLAMPSLAALNQRVATRCYLSTWNSEETRNYVTRQFERAGASDDVPFDDSAISQIAECTDGVPRLVNQLCDHALMLAAAAGVQEMNAAGIEEAWADLQNLPAPVQASTAAFEDAMDESILEFGTLDGEESPDSANQTEDTYEVNATHEYNDTPEMAGTTYQPDLSDFEPVNAEYEVPSDEIMDSEPAETAAGAQFATNEDEGFVTQMASETSMLSAVNATAITQDSASDYETENDEVEQPMVAGTTSTNPFLEEFETEEIVIGRVIRICDESAVLTENVRTEEGQTLANVLNLIDMTKESTKPRFHETIADQIETQNQMAVAFSGTEVASNETYDQPTYMPSPDADEVVRGPELASSTQETGNDSEDYAAYSSTTESVEAIEAFAPSTDGATATAVVVESTQVENSTLNIRADEPVENGPQTPRKKPKRFGRLFTRLSQQ